MIEEMIGALLRDESVVIIGPSDSGKSYWVQNTLILKLEEVGKSVRYAKDGFTEISFGDIAVFDEAETLFDIERLEERHPDARPYYSEKYLRQVSDWHTKYASHKEPSVYIISRDEADVSCLAGHFKIADWDGRPLRTFHFLL